jgi:hypothetical protein
MNIKIAKFFLNEIDLIDQNVFPLFNLITKKIVIERKQSSSLSEDCQGLIYKQMYYL